MIDDEKLVERLRKWTRIELYDSTGEPRSVDDDLEEAASRISALTAEVSDLKHDIERHLKICGDLSSEMERLRAALKPFLACFTEGPNGIVKVMPTDDDFRNAHAAAQEKQ